MVPSLTNRFDSFRVASAVIALGVAAPMSRAESQRVLTVVARDTALESSPTVPAGLTTVKLTLNGSVRRELVVHRVPAGTTPEDLVRGAAGRPERWFHQWSFGGPAVPRDTTKEAVATFDLRPGRYTLVAYEVDPAGRARGSKYIWREFTAVAASVLIPSRFGVPDLTVRVSDSRMEVVGVVRKGQRTIQVENNGGRPHDFLVARLDSGKTIDDVRRWDRDRGDPPPFAYAGGLTPMSGDMTAQTKLLLQTGTYVVLCTMRHSGDREHDYRRGVLASFKVN